MTRLAQPPQKTFDSTPITHAIEAVMDYWEWWDTEPDSDYMVASRSSFPAARHTIQISLPADLQDNEELIERIMVGTRTVALDERYLPAFNLGLLQLSIDPSEASAQAVVSEVVAGGITEERALKLVDLAKLVINYS